MDNKSNKSNGAGRVGGSIFESTFDAIDPNEPLYCLCRQFAYGDMIACDNEDCEIEWFHMPCVKLKSTPKGGHWLCPVCAKKSKGRPAKK